MSTKDHFDPNHYGQADRREVDPTIQVETATWFAEVELDWQVKKRQERFGRVGGPDGRQEWIKAAFSGTLRGVDGSH